VPCYTCENEQRVTFLCLSICILSPQFIHFAKVSKDKLKETFLEGFEKNGYLDAKDRFAQFLDIFSFDVKANDVIDLILDKDKTIVKLNGSVLKELSIDGLSDGVLKIYLGEDPADKGLKKAMLGQ
jgi:hypothetical protein